MHLTAEILCLGNELLIGRTVNTNATDISLEFSRIGFKITRITTVRDELEAASKSLLEILERKPNVVICSGGLGPTHDDIQLDVIAHALNRKLEYSEQAIKMLEQRYNITREKISEVRLKMTKIPVGSSVLKNREGSAPGVLTEYNGILIFSLPGVPREMKSILLEEIIPVVKSRLKIDEKLNEFGFEARGIGEASIENITNLVASKFPKVNFKSHPRKDDNGYWLSLHCYNISNNEKMVFEACKEWKAELLRNFDVKTTEIKKILKENYIPLMDDNTASLI